MRPLIVDNYIINKPIIDILYRLQLTLTNGKLKDIKVGTDNIVVTCPRHADGREASPACNIYIGDDESVAYGFTNCFVCGKIGSFSQFVAECFDCSESYAKHWLIKTFEGELIERPVFMADAIQIGPKKAPITRKINKSVLDSFQKWTPYLGKRKLLRETCEKFRIRYDSKYRQLIFPVFNQKDDLLMLVKRSIDTKSFYIDKSQPKPLYCFDQILKNKVQTAVVTEGPIDTLLGNQYGMPTFGTFGMPSDIQIDQVNKSDIKVLYLMFDNDEAGKKFNRMFHQRINPRIILIDVEIPSPYKDIGDLSQELFWEAINKAKNSKKF